MASTPNKYAVEVHPVNGPSALLIFDAVGAANAVINSITDNSDARAYLHGQVHELPMTLNGDFEGPSDVQRTFLRDFRRATSGRNFLDVRNVERHEVKDVEGEPDGVYWTGTVLWAFTPTAPEQPADALAEKEA